MQAESTAAAQFIDFQPTKEAASDILCALADPDQTITEIAKRFHTTIDALADWFDSPPVQERIEKMKRFAANREQFILTMNKRLALEALVSILEAHKHDEQHIPVDPQNLKAVTQRDRRRAAARLAASQLIRLCGLCGPSGTGVPPVHSAQGPHDPDSHPRRTPTPHNPQVSQSQAGRLCHTDHQTNSPPNPSPAHPLTSSPPPTPSTPTQASPCDNKTEHHDRGIKELSTTGEQQRHSAPMNLPPSSVKNHLYPSAS